MTPGGSSCPSQLDDAVKWAKAVPSALTDLWGFSIAARTQTGLVPLGLAVPIWNAMVGAELVAYVVTMVLRGGCTVGGVVLEQAATLRRTIDLVRPFAPAALAGPLSPVSAALSGNVDARGLCTAFNAARGLSPSTSGLPAIPCALVPPASFSTSGMTSTMIAQRRAQEAMKAKVKAAAMAEARARLLAKFAAAAKTRREELQASLRAQAKTDAAARVTSRAAAKKGGELAGGARAGGGRAGYAAAGAGIGFVVGGPVGAAAGATLGWLVGGR
jgi:hypothetical protein